MPKQLSEFNIFNKKMPNSAINSQCIDIIGRKLPNFFYFCKKNGLPSHGKVVR
jgi:hypothetical protein